MKILFTRFPLESAYGGAEIQTISLMKGLSERGHAVAFLGSCPVLRKESEELHLPSALLDIGPPPVSKWHALSFLWRGKTMQTKLEGTLNTFQDLDAIVMLSLSEKILLTPLALKKGIKVFWLEHDPVGNWLTKNPWLRDLRSLSKDTTTIVVSNLSKRLYEGLGWDPDTLKIIPNGVDPERIEGISHTPQEKPRLHIGCIARLAEEKGVDLLIEALADHPDMSLTIIGTGREEGYIKKLIAEISEHEHITPPRIQLLRSASSLKDFYTSIDALVLPSRTNDPFGLVIAEAMMMGLPTLCTDACGIAEFLENGKNGVVVKANSAEEISKGLSAVKNVSLRQTLSQEGLTLAKKLFSVQGMLDQYEMLLSSKS